MLENISYMCVVCISCQLVMEDIYVCFLFWILFAYEKDKLDFIELTKYITSLQFASYY